MQVILLEFKLPRRESGILQFFGSQKKVLIQIQYNCHE
jgi:hypothetical protein